MAAILHGYRLSAILATMSVSWAVRRETSGRLLLAPAIEDERYASWFVVQLGRHFFIAADVQWVD